MTKEKQAFRCPKCGHEWNYRGKSIYYVTCSHCYRKIHVKYLKGGDNNGKEWKGSKGNTD